VRGHDDELSVLVVTARDQVDTRVDVLDRPCALARRRGN
jgi:DNA-binding response OmpR family regulator